MAGINNDVVVIGGGVAGLSIACRLAAAGAGVTVLERGACGQEASWSAAGIIAPCSWHRRDELARMHMDAIFRYHEFAADLHQRSGVDPQFRRCGQLRLILDDNRMKMAVNEVRAVAERRTPEGWPIVQTLTAEQARIVEPHLDGAMLGVQHCRMTAAVRNPRLLQALMVAGRRGEVVIREGFEVRQLIRQGDRVLGARAADDEVWADWMVVCAGAWSAALDPVLAEHTPVHPVRGQMLLLHQEPPPLTRIIHDENHHFYMVPRGDGHILVGSTLEPDSGFSKRNTARALAELSSRALGCVSCLANATLLRSWSGLRPGTPDRRPFIGSVPGADRLLAVTGLYRTGLALAPVLGDIVLEMMRSGSCRYDLKKAAPGRTYPPPPNPPRRTAAV